MKPTVAPVMILGILCGQLSAQDRPPQMKQLLRTVGKWNAEINRRFTDGETQDQKFQSSIVTEPILDGSFIRGISNSHFSEAPERTTKLLVLTTWDSERKAYRSWTFQSTGMMTSWKGAWDPDLRIMHWHSRTSEPDRAIEVKTTYPDDGTIHSELSRRSDAGEPYFEKIIRTRKKGVLPDFTRELWDRIETPIRPIPVEVKQLKPLIGEWQADYIHYPSRAFPDGHRTAARITTRWILDGRFLLGRAKLENYETLWVIGYDSDASAYRYVRFDSNGDVEENIGTWKPDAHTFEWKLVNGDPGVEKTTTMHLIGDHLVQSKIQARDAEGEVLLDLLIRSERQE